MHRFSYTNKPANRSEQRLKLGCTTQTWLMTSKSRFARLSQAIGRRGMGGDMVGGQLHESSFLGKTLEVSAVVAILVFPRSDIMLKPQ